MKFDGLNHDCLTHDKITLRLGGFARGFHAEGRREYAEYAGCFTKMKTKLKLDGLNHDCLPHDK
ncbi:hypothetical protein SAMN05216556_1118 [Aequorivita viscosa]|uniref:Uncharacterized protein n=1 Tax=Aequorivita viscosa TaxID=797419 RepID=A0A1M6GK73_9FLAO|nr:hypothetical protein SAMN05216556_1118 [Aequorivita viscosa]SHJ10328.1 hypothetical protein SAMN04487908_109105 [Aequorivita viscosa]